MIFYLHGSDTFRMRKELIRLKEKFLKEVDASGMSIEYFDGKEMSFEQFRNAIVSSSLFSRKRMLIVENPFAVKDAQEPMQSLLQKQKNTDCILIFFDEKNSAKTSGKSASVLEKFLLKQKYVFIFSPLAERELSVWIQNEVKSHGLEVSVPALKLLMQLGNDLWRMQHEISKISHYCLGIKARTIDAAMVKSFVELPIDDNIFHLVEAFSRRDVVASLRIFEDQLKSGVNALYILSMLYRQARILWELKCYQKRPGVSVEMMAKDLSLHPYVVKKTLAQASEFSLEQVRKWQEDLMEIDQLLKSTRLSPFLLFERMIVRISSMT